MLPTLIQASVLNRDIDVAGGGNLGQLTSQIRDVTSGTFENYGGHWIVRDTTNAIDVGVRLGQDARDLTHRVGEQWRPEHRDMEPSATALIRGRCMFLDRNRQPKPIGQIPYMRRHVFGLGAITQFEEHGKHELIANHELLDVDDLETVASQFGEQGAGDPRAILATEGHQHRRHVRILVISMRSVAALRGDRRRYAHGVSGPIWTLPNGLSVARLLGVPLFLWLVLSAQADVWAFAVLVVAGITDWLDGFLARRLDQRSALGAILDPLADRLYIAATLIGLALRAFIPWWLVGVLVLREVMLLAIWPAIRRQGVIALPVSLVGKAGTFALLWGFPFLLLSAQPDPLGFIAAALGWSFALWGTWLYWWAGLAYVRTALRGLG